jgi:hypothetical protein
MYWATVKMQTLMTILLLKRAGLNEAVIVTALKGRYRTMAERAAWQKATEIGTNRG